MGEFLGQEHDTLRAAVRLASLTMKIPEMKAFNRWQDEQFLEVERLFATAGEGSWKRRI